MAIWHAVISLPGLDTNHYFAKEAQPTFAEVDAYWQLDGSSPLVKNYRDKSLRDAYPALTKLVELPIVTLKEPETEAGKAIDRLPEWPAEPWITSYDDVGAIFQEGNDSPILVVDQWANNPDQYVHDTAERVVACVNALAGIEDPEAFVAEAKRLGLTTGVAA